MSDSTVAKKVIYIVLDIVLSFVVFIVTTLIVDLIAGKIVGTTLQADGTKVLNGGGTTSVTLLTISFITTILFAVWFYKFTSSHKISKARIE